MTLRELYKVNFNWKKSTIINLHCATTPDEVDNCKTMSVDGALAEYGECDVLFIYKQEVYIYNDR